MHCLIQLGVVQNPLAGKTSLKQALYLQQSLVYPELRLLNWLGYQTDIATTKYTKKGRKKTPSKKQKWLLGTDCLTLPNYCNFIKGSSNCLAVLRARSDNDKADHLPTNTKVWEKASVPFFFSHLPQPILFRRSSAAKATEEGRRAESEAMPIFLSCTLACTPATVNPDHWVKTFFHQILNK